MGELTALRDRLQDDKARGILIPDESEVSETMQITTVKIEKPDEINFILGQSHFIKTVEDIHEALVQTVPGIKFGLAFCESSGEMLVRWTGTDDAMIDLAKRNALALSAGHSFILFLGAGFFPISILNTLKMVPEICRIFCATANPVEVLIAETDQGRGILGVIDGGKSKGVEGAEGIAWRKEFLRKIGYKL
jgi:hypothetical protein